jgi:DNA repair exonuclease SbcCD ATPase subunit
VEFDDLMKLVLGQPANKVVEWLKANGKAIYQPIFNDGHGVATAAKSQEIEALDAKVKAAEKAKGEAETTLEKYKSENPNASALHAEYGEKIKGFERQIEDLKTQQAEKERTGRIEGAVSLLKTKLNAVVVDEALAESLAEKTATRKRIQVDDQGNLRILQPNSSIPFAGDTEAQVQALADELKGGLKPVLLRSGVEKGTGKETASGGTGSSGEEAEAKQFFDSIRNKVSKKAETAAVGANGVPAAPDPRTALEQRLGMKPTTAL